MDTAAAAEWEDDPSIPRETEIRKMYATHTAISPGPEIFISFIAIAGWVALVVGVWRIVAKAGYNGAWALTAFVPVLNVVMFLVFAFSDWPVLDQRSAGLNPPPPPPPR